jgi:hypothetical protein
MSEGKINIAISGGNANFGNVTQGNHNTSSVQSQTITGQAEQAFTEFFAGLEECRSRNDQQATQIDALKDEMAALKAALEQNPESRKGSLLDKAKALYDKYGWAAGLLKKIFVVLLPGWLP